MIAKLDELKKEYEDITVKLSQNEIISDTQKFRTLSKRQNKLRTVVEKYDYYLILEKNIGDNKGLIESDEDAEMKAMAQEEKKL